MVVLVGRLVHSLPIPFTYRKGSVRAIALSLSLSWLLSLNLSLTFILYLSLSFSLCLYLSLCFILSLARSLYLLLFLSFFHSHALRFAPKGNHTIHLRANQSSTHPSKEKTFKNASY